MYVRVKRQKTTMFITAEPQESGLEVKAKLQKLLDNKDPADMKLVLVKNGVELDDAKLLADLHVQNDDEVGLCFKKEGAADGETVWEEVDITPPTEQAKAS